MVQLLLDNDVDANCADVDIFNKANKTAAELASENGKADVARFIGEYKADANIRNKICSTTLDTALYGANGDGEEKIASYLDAAEEGDIGLESLSCCSIREWISTAVVQATKTPLRIAAINGKVGVVHSLIERGAEADSRDKWGWTPLS